MEVKAQTLATQKLAATNSRTFRTFLLMQQFAAAQIGARIKEARLARGLTQEQLAEMCSFSKRSLQDYETGVTIPYKHFRELGQLLNRRSEWFLYGDEATAAAEADPAVIERLDRIERVLEALVDEDDQGEQQDPAQTGP